MKNHFIIQLFAAIAVVSALASCTKDDGTAPTSKICLVTSLSADGDTLKNTFEYDVKNKLAKLQSYRDRNTTAYHYSYNYNGSKIEQKYVGADGTAGSTIVYTLGDNGFASSAVETSKGTNWEKRDSVSYKYNRDGYLIQEDRKSFHKSANGSFIFDGKSSTRYTISNGNRVKTAYTHGNVTSVSVNQFYAQKNTTNLFNPASITGKSDRNLIKKTEGTDYTYAYSYEFDQNNNPVKATLTSDYNNKISQEVMLLNYSCK